MVVIFALCWIPFNVLNLLRDLQPGSIDTKSYFIFLFILAHLISMSATGWNPILYAWMNENFRREFKFVLPCFRTVPKRTTVCRSTFRDSEAPHDEETPLRNAKDNEYNKSNALTRNFSDGGNQHKVAENEKNSKFVDVAESVGHILANSAIEDQRDHRFDL
ncbi:unnamed protein product [Soboliphyme baturini]|uniref:G_PROTEIN_RECEP_F1_2 domain-containing protein n=1 Tax=Soboliphyme baturini TaxID=241478 RepID=A0A183J700_9BILA|nr:unnamed protein product [Soboliphyme baturini]